MAAAAPEMRGVALPIRDLAMFCNEDQSELLAQWVGLITACHGIFPRLTVLYSGCRVRAERGRVEL